MTRGGGGGGGGQIPPFLRDVICGRPLAVGHQGIHSNFLSKKPKDY